MLADEICSTERMVSYCRHSPAKEIIIATEAGMLHRLQKECPDKTFIPAPSDHCRCNECRFMKMNTLEKLHDCMLNRSPSIELSPEILSRARLPIERMLEISVIANGLETGIDADVLRQLPTEKIGKLAAR